MTVTWTHGEAPHGGPHHAGGLPVASATSGQQQHHNTRASGIEQCSEWPYVAPRSAVGRIIEVGPRSLQSVKRREGDQIYRNVR